MDVDVYWNLHKDIYSVRDRSTGRVWKHLCGLVVENASLVVGELSRQRVIRERRKNVHAYVRGVISESLCEIPEEAFRVCYNPYRGPHWTTIEGNIVGNIQKAWCITNKEGKPEVYAI